MLGLGVFVGIMFLVDCYVIVEELGFDFFCLNSLDVVFDRDFVFELLFVVSISMMYLFCFVEDMIFYNLGEVGFL